MKNNQNPVSIVLPKWCVKIDPRELVKELNSHHSAYGVWLLRKRQIYLAEGGCQGVAIRVDFQLEPE